MDIHEIVKKLVGDINPTGETNTDNERFKNLKMICDLIDNLLVDVDNVRYYKNYVEFSKKRAGVWAEEFFNELGITESYTE